MSALLEWRSLAALRAGRCLALPDGHIGAGEALMLCGDNGTGKTTLLHILAGLETQARGEILIEGQTAGRSRPGWLTLLPQRPSLLRRGVLAGVALGPALHGFGRARARTMALEALREVGLDPLEFGHRSWRELSGGETRRAALAARLAVRPRLLLLDEPTNDLDQRSRERMITALTAARQASGMAVIVATHDQGLSEALEARTLFF